MKYIFCLLSALQCILLCSGISAFGQAPDVLEPAFSMLDEKPDWKSPALGEALKAATKHAGTPRQALTAKTMLIGHLMSLDTKESLAEASTLANNVAQSPADTWQRALGRFYVAAIYNLQGDTTRQLPAAREALSGIDFGELEKSKDSYFVRLQGLFGTTPSDLRDALQVMVAKGYARDSNYKDADRAISQIKSPKAREEIAGHVRAIKRGRDEAVAEAKRKSALAPKAR